MLLFQIEVSGRIFQLTGVIVATNALAQVASLSLHGSNDTMISFMEVVLRKARSCWMHLRTIRSISILEPQSRSSTSNINRVMLLGPLIYTTLPLDVVVAPHFLLKKLIYILKTKWGPKHEEIMTRTLNSLYPFYVRVLNFFNKPSGTTSRGAK